MSGGVSATVKILLHPTKFYPSQMTPLFTQPRRKTCSFQNKIMDQAQLGTSDPLLCVSSAVDFARPDEPELCFPPETQIRRLALAEGEKKHEKNTSAKDVAAN